MKEGSLAQSSLPRERPQECVLPDASVLSVPASGVREPCHCWASVCQCGFWDVGQQRHSQLQRQSHSKRKKKEEITRQGPWQRGEAAKQAAASPRALTAAASWLLLSSVTAT